MKKTILAAFFLLPLFGMSQELKLKGNYGGVFSLGTRTTVSTFNGHEDENNGLGLGGQFRIGFSDRVNSDWFFDYIRSSIGDYASRTDYHIGWSVLFYPTIKPDALLRPYVLAGHCFDYTQITDNQNSSNMAERWSSAVQGGAGVHLNLSPRLDISFVGQYMLHLGNQLHAERESGIITYHDEKGASTEGHLLFHVGINYKIADLW